MEKEKFEQHKRQIGGDVTEFLNRVCHPVLIKKRNIKEFKKEVSTCVYLEKEHIGQREEPEGKGHAGLGEVRTVWLETARGRRSQWEMGSEGQGMGRGPYHTGPYRPQGL